MALKTLDNKETTEDVKTARRKKRRLERLAIILTVLVIIGLTVLQTRVIRLGTDVPIAHSVLIFVVVNINIVLLFILLLLVLRNLYKIFFEEKQLLGAHLRTKLVVAFVSLSLVPTILLFYSGLQFITTAHDYWFDEKVEQSLADSLVLAQFSADMTERLTMEFGSVIRNGLISQDLLTRDHSADLLKFIREKRREYDLALVDVYGIDLKPAASARGSELESLGLPPLSISFFTQAMTRKGLKSRVDELEHGDVIRVVWPLIVKDKGLAGFLVAGNRTLAPIKQRMNVVSRGLEEYHALKRIHEPIRVSHLIALAIIALLSIFISTWIGFHLAKSITGPIMELAAGTKRIAQGDYDFTIEVHPTAGEIGTLVESFNRMTLDLKAGEEQLMQKNIELERSNSELEQRRRYIETIVRNVAAGVISADALGRVTTINKSAEEILSINAAGTLGRPLTEILLPEQREILEGMMLSAERSRRHTAEKQARVMFGHNLVSLKLHLTRLLDENNEYIGLVIVVDDMTEMEKMQRMAAWREVARRIAHEIKNPLTPIQLSAQRLRRRYGEKLGEEGVLFDECTEMIIRQVDEMKRLVNEFSNFARLPEAKPTLNDLSSLVEETLVLYTEAHKDIEFSAHKDPNLPAFNLDREQIKRAVINLLDNAVAATESGGGIAISLSYDPLLRMARLEVADDGIGIQPQDKHRLFEPYFSTKKSGTGLGLAIVKTIVNDHNGFVRIQDNHPRGTRVILELPVKQ